MIATLPRTHRPVEQTSAITQALRRYYGAHSRRTRLCPQTSSNLRPPRPPRHLPHTATGSPDPRRPRAAALMLLTITHPHRPLSGSPIMLIRTSCGYNAEKRAEEFACIDNDTVIKVPTMPWGTA